MAEPVLLTPDEEKRCLDALNLLGIQSSDHQILSHRGYFTLFLSGLNAGDFGDGHPSGEEFRQIQRLLARAGVDKLKQILGSRPVDADRPASSRAVSGITPVKATVQAPKNPVDDYPKLPPQPPLPPRPAVPPEKPKAPVLSPPPRPTALAPPPQPLAPPPPPSVAPPPKPPNRATESVTAIPRIPTPAHESPAPEIAAQDGNSPRDGSEPEDDGLTPITARTAARLAKSSHGASSEIGAVSPPPKAKERMRNLPSPTTPKEAVTEARKFAEQNHYHDAQHILADYLSEHGLDDVVLKAAAGVIRMAGEFDRDKGVAPFNMLWECEELAHILAKYIPDMSSLSETNPDSQSAVMYQSVKLVYETWTDHGRTLLEYRFRLANDRFVRRSWVEPRDLGFLLDVFRAGVNSRLPLDLMRLIYVGAKESIELTKKVIAFPEKRAKFEGDLLRIIASPVKDVVPDLQLEMYRDIAKCYLDEGDTTTADIFIRQGLLLRKGDKQLLALQERLTELMSKRGKRAAGTVLNRPGG